MYSKHLVNIFSIILPFSMVFAFYALPIIGNLGPLILYIVFTLMLLYDFFSRRALLFDIPKELFIFFIYALISQPLAFILGGGFDTARLINLITVLVMILILSYIKLNVSLFYKSYQIIGIISAGLIAIQFIKIFILGQIVHPIMLLPIKVYESWYSGGVRPTGVFPEPAAFATFIIPLICHLLEEKKITKAFLFTLTVFMSTSSLGIIVISFLWLSEMFKTSLKPLYKAIITICVVTILIIISRTELFYYATDKILNTDFTNDVRLTRGFIIFNKLNWENKIFGIGANNLNYYLENRKIILTDIISKGMRNKAYITGLFQVMIFYGLIGLSIYLFFIINNIKKSSNKAFAIAFILMSMASSFLFNINWLVYTLIILNDCIEKSTIKVEFVNRYNRCKHE